MGKEAKGSEKLRLGAVIQSLREELAEAQKDAEGQDIRFAVEDVEVELLVSVEEGIKAGVAAMFYVLTPKYEAQKKELVTQKLKLKLRPGRYDTTPDPSGATEAGTTRFSPVTISGEY